MLLICGFAFGGTMEEFNLKNNIKVIFDKTDGIEVVSMKIFTPVAAAAETRENSGISLLTSNLMVKSTKNRDNKTLAADIDDIGAEVSVSADYDAQHITINFLPEYFDKASEILSDIIKNPAFDENEIAAEKRDIIAGQNSRKDRIFNTALDTFTLNFYKDHPYALTVLGTEESIKAITKEDISKWHSYSFNAGNILISISGNTDKKTLKACLEKYFGGMEKGGKYEPAKSGTESRESKIIDIKGKFNQAYIMKGFAAPDLKDEDFVSLKTASAVMGGRMTSRLFTELREKLGLAYEVNAIYPSRKDESYFMVYIGLDKKNIDLALKKIDEVLNDLCDNEVGRQELEDTKTYIKGLYIMDRQTVEKKAYYYGWREITGQGYAYDGKYLEDIDGVTSSDLKRAANKIFKKNSLTVIVRPDEK